MSGHSFAALLPRVRRRPRGVLAAAAAVLALLFGTAITPAASGGVGHGTVRTFEDDALGTVPAGCRTPTGAIPAQVTDARAHGGQRSLLLRDDSTTAQAVVVCPTGAMAGADLRLPILPEQLSNGVLVSLLGTFVGKPQTDVPVFHLWVKPDGSVWWFDGLAQDSLGWTQIAAAGTLAVGEWNALAVQVPEDMGQAAVYVGDHPGQRPHRDDFVGPAGPVGVSPVESITGFQVASTGSTPVGDEVYVDDVVIRDGRHVSSPPKDRTFSVGEPVIIDQTSEGFMQMPNTATTLTTGDGLQEVLVGYPVHGDATHDTGTALAASTDRGRTWVRADERNPFPDEQSFYLSTLSNGDLFAVNYHTFMVEGSGETQAIVPTAVSSDGGRTWTHREGVMEAPQAMRPISDATSRPGFRLGGFVLIHSVVEGDDGTLYQSGYGFYEDDERSRAVLLASTDGGVNWEVRSTIAVDPDLSDHPRFEGFTEAAIAVTAGGDLLAVIRTGNYQPLYQVTSNDDGHTWTEPEQVVAGPDEIPVVGVFPDLLPMPDGTMVLWIGRPGQSLLASPDGEGESWTTPVTVDYLNSGNGSLVSLGGDRVLTFGDRGADWTPNAPEVKAVWARPVRLRL